MPITDYASLKTAVETWRERAGDAVITGNAADFISLAESRLNRILPLREMWTDTALSGTDLSRELALPTDFVEAGYLVRTTDGNRVPLTPKTARTLLYSTTAGTPSLWAINGNAIDLNCPCSGVHTFILRYRQKFALSEEDDTNWLLTNHPDVYLAAVLVWSGLLVKAEDIETWKSILDEAVDELAWIDSRSEGHTTLTTDFVGRGGYDFLTDSYIS